MLLIDKIKDIQTLIRDHEAEKLFLQSKDSSILSYVLEKKKELGEAQQELTSQKIKNTNLISSLVKGGSGSPIYIEYSTTTNHERFLEWSNTRCVTVSGFSTVRE